MANSILIDVNRCTGCWTCSMACKKANGLALDEYRMFIRTIGGGGIDQAGGTWPNLYLKWNPVYTRDCPNCRGDEYTSGVPYCAFNCPTGALTWGNADDPDSAISRRREELLNRGYHLWQQPEWEATRGNVYYIEKGI